MAKAGYCGTCGENVYLNPDGSCPKGHGADCVSNVYDVPDAPAAAPAPAYTAPPAYAPQAAAYTAPAAPPKKKRTGLIIAIVLVVLLLLCGCGAAITFAVIAASNSDSSSSSSEAPKADPEKAKTEAAWALMKGITTGDAELIKSSIPSETVAAVPPDSWTSFAASSKSAGVGFKSETWAGAVLTVITDGPSGSATVTITPSRPDATSVEILSLKDGRDPLTLTMKLVDEDGSWKVLSMVTPDGAIPFDKEGFLNFAGVANP
ncbi:MAG TPA: hypothetical protein VF902_04420 [Coriobacteriia bacterium]